MTTEIQRLTIDDIAPVPKKLQDVTAECLATHFAAYAQLHFRLMLEHPDQGQRQQSTVNFCNYYMIAGLLRDLAERGDEQGGAVALDLWENIARGYGHVSGPEVWSWLAADGIAPEWVNGIAEQMIDEYKAEPKPIVLERPALHEEITEGPIRDLTSINRRIFAEVGRTSIVWESPEQARLFAAHLADIADAAEGAAR